MCGACVVGAEAQSRWPPMRLPSGLGADDGTLPVNSASLRPSAVEDISETSRRMQASLFCTASDVGNSGARFWEIVASVVSVVCILHWIATALTTCDVFPEVEDLEMIAAGIFSRSIDGSLHSPDSSLGLAPSATILTMDCSLGSTCTDGEEGPTCAAS